MTITVVGLGPGDPGLLTLAARDALTSGRPVFFRTRRHPGVEALAVNGPWESFDALYDGGETFEAVYDAIVARLSEAGGAGEIVYAVPGDPLFGEATVQRLLERGREGTGPVVRVVHGVSFLEPVCAALGLDPLAGMQIVDALEPRLDPARPAIVAQVYARHAASGLKLALLDLYPAAHPVTVVRGAGLPEAHIETLPLEAIDRRDGLFDHLVCLYLPALAPEASVRTFDGLRAISHRLRSPEGCPWDREQTHASLKKFLLEETYEALDALDADDPAALREELGDLLLQMTLHTEIAEEHGEFTYGDVFQSINEKLIRRHPHVFADADIQTADEQWKLWQQIKRAEKPKDESILAGVSRSMPALAYAQAVQERAARTGFDRHRREEATTQLPDAVQERAARTGFDWPSLDQVLDKLVEELGELRDAADLDEREDEFGDVLFVLANVARWLGLDAEAALRRTNAKFYRRFSGMEALAHERGRALDGMTLDEMEALYQEVKARE